MLHRLVAVGSTYALARTLGAGWVVPRARMFGSEGEVLAAMNQPGFDPRVEVLLESTSPANAPDAAGRGAGRPVVDVTFRCDTVDVTLAPVWRADFNALAIPVDRVKPLAVILSEDDREWPYR